MARDFNGSSDFISVSDSTSLRSPTTALTVGAWHKVPSSAGGPFSSIIMKGVNNDNNPWDSYNIRQNNTNRGQYSAAISDGTNGSQVATGVTSTLTANTWYFFALRWAQGSSVALDVFNADGTLNQTVVSASSSITIGYDTTGFRMMKTIGPDYLRGGVFGAFVDNRKWTDSQVKAAMFGNMPLQPSAIHIPVWGDSIEADYSGNKNNGVVTGSTIIDNPPIVPLSFNANIPQTVVGVRIAVTTVAINTVVGDQDITTIDLGGLTPKLALFYISRATVLGTTRNHRVIGFGAADGIREWAGSTSSEHNKSPNVTNNISSTSACILKAFEGSSNADIEASFVSFISNGVRINLSNINASNAFLVTVVLFSGSDVSAHVDTVTTGSQDVTTVVTAPQFTPNLLLTHYNHGRFAGGVSALNDSFGYVHNGASITARSISNRVNNNNTAAQIQQRIDTTYGLAVLNSSGVPSTGFIYDNFSANGFSITPKLSGASYKTGYVALKFTGKEVWVGTILPPTSPGNDVQTNFGLTPDFVQHLLTRVTSIDVGHTSSASEIFGISNVTLTAENTVSVAEQDNANPSVNKSHSENSAILAYRPLSTLAYDATLVSFDSDGYTFNYATTQTTQRYFIGFAIGSLTNTTVNSDSILSLESLQDIQKNNIPLLTFNEIINVDNVIPQESIGKIVSDNKIHIEYDGAVPIIGHPLKWFSPISRVNLFGFNMDNLANNTMTISSTQSGNEFNGNTYVWFELIATFAVAPTDNNPAMVLYITRAPVVGNFEDTPLTGGAQQWHQQVVTFPVQKIATIQRVIVGPILLPPMRLAYYLDNQAGQSLVGGAVNDVYRIYTNLEQK